MAKQTIGIGASANDGSGDPLRIAFDKVNDNFNEIYSNSGTTGNTLIDLFDSSGNLDLYNKPHKISFLYSTEAALLATSPSTYHGAIGHAHNTGSLYYAHGSWRRLLSDNSNNDITSYTDPLSKHVYLSNISNAETADYVLKTNADGTYTWAAQSGGSGGGSYANADVDTHLNVSGASADQILSWNGTDYAWIADATGGSAGDSFKTIAIGGINIVADSATDTLNLVAGANITLTANSSSDTVTIASAGGGGGGGTDLNSLNAGVIDVASDSIGFIDNNDSSTSKKETIVDLVEAIAGTGLSGSAGVLSSTITQYANADVNAHLNISSAANNEVLSWTGSDYDWVAAASGSTTLLGLSDVGSDGTNGQVLTTDGSGAFAFTTISGGGGASRVSEAETTSSIADGASASVQYATLGKSFALQKVTVNKQCWVRIYSDTTARTADASRTQGTDPADGSGVIAEFIATSANTEFKVTPSIMGWLDDSETEVPVAIQNNSGSTGTVQVTIDALKLES
jgi:hypothetical protein